MTAVTQGSDGSVVIDAGGTVTYDPDPGFSGTDTFTYTVTAGGVTETATVTVTVTNTAPNAVDDTGTTDEDNALSVPQAAGLIQSNDTDPDGDTLTVNEVNGSVASVGNKITLA